MSNSNHDVHFYEELIRQTTEVTTEQADETPRLITSSELKPVVIKVDYKPEQKNDDRTIPTVEHTAEIEEIEIKFESTAKVTPKLKSVSSPIEPKQPAMKAEDIITTEIKDLELPEPPVSENETEAIKFEPIEVKSEQTELVSIESPEDLVQLLSLAAATNQEFLDIEANDETPQITLEIADKIQTLDIEEVNYVIETFSEIVNLVSHISELRETCLDAIVSEKDLQELCIQLLDYIEIDYDDERFEQFIKSLIIINELLKVGNSIIDKGLLTNFAFDNGTHESKYWARLTSYSRITHKRLHQILGMFVLINIGLPLG